MRTCVRRSRLALAELHASPLLAHLLAALEDGQASGHYGRLAFVMVARHFAEEDEIVTLLTRDEAVSDVARRPASRPT